MIQFTNRYITSYYTYICIYDKCIFPLPDLLAKWLKVGKCTPVLSGLHKRIYIYTHLEDKLRLRIPETL